jgi:hypothetical protein
MAGYLHSSSDGKEGGYCANSLSGKSLREGNVKAAMEHNADNEQTNLLWTGGWDSTFHLLQLLTVHRRRVRPFYLIDSNRPGTGVELKTIRTIKDRLFMEYPYTRELLQPGYYFAVEDLRPDPEITGAFQATLQEKRIGSQYEWLARFCRQNSMRDLELCIHRDDKAHRVIEQLVSKCDTYPYTTYRMEPRHKFAKEYLLFGNFNFPIFNLSKLEMAAIAEEQGWKDIMEMTWFCHRPNRDLKPCGRCKPCIYTIEEGLGWRLPLRSRAAYFFQNRIVWRLKSRLMRSAKRSGGLNGA